MDPVIFTDRPEEWLLSDKKNISLHVHLGLINLKRKKKKKRTLKVFRTTYCKTQDSGLRSKEEKPRDPMNQSSRCNTQEGLLSVVQTGDSDLLGGRAPQQQIGQAFYMQKTILSAYYIRVTR